VRQQRSTTSPPQGKNSCAIAVLQLPFHFLWSIKPEVIRIKVNGDQVILSVLGALELLCTAFYQTLVLKGREKFVKRHNWKRQEVSAGDTGALS